MHVFYIVTCHVPRCMPLPNPAPSAQALSTETLRTPTLGYPNIGASMIRIGGSFKGVL